MLTNATLSELESLLFLLKHLCVINSDYETRNQADTMLEKIRNEYVLNRNNDNIETWKVQAIRLMYEYHGLIGACRTYRGLMNCSLIEAKKQVEHLRKIQGWQKMT